MSNRYTCHVISNTKDGIFTVQPNHNVKVARKENHKKSLYFSVKLSTIMYIVLCHTYFKNCSGSICKALLPYGSIIQKFPSRILSPVCSPGQTILQQFHHSLFPPTDKIQNSKSEKNMIKQKYEKQIISLESHFSDLRTLGESVGRLCVL